MAELGFVEKGYLLFVGLYRPPGLKSGSPVFAYCVVFSYQTWDIKLTTRSGDGLLSGWCCIRPLKLWHLDTIYDYCQQIKFFYEITTAKTFCLIPVFYMTPFFISCLCNSVFCFMQWLTLDVLRTKYEILCSQLSSISLELCCEKTFTLKTPRERYLL